MQTCNCTNGYKYNNECVICGAPWVSETKFTKGPWMHTPEGPADSQGYGVCALWGSPGSEEQIANSHLIAAAPEMYDALNEVAEGMEEAGGSSNWNTAKEIRKILAKARGE